MHSNQKISNLKSNECIICGVKSKPGEEDQGFYFSDQGSGTLFFCPAHADSFKLGLSLGQIELNSKTVAYLSGLNESASLSDIKKAILEVSPSTKKSLRKSSAVFDRKLPTTPSELYGLLSEYVVGQDQAKRDVSVAVIHHLYKIKQNKKSTIPDKHNILMLGPSGSGKTLIGNSVAHILNLPFSSGDATNYSPTGFHGQDCDSIVHDLLIKTQLNVELAQKGILFVDELDKLSSYNSAGTRTETLNFGTQSTLLKLIEGKTIKVPGQLFGEPMGTSIDVDTTNMLFFFGGAFNGLADIVGKLSGFNSKKIGFRSDDEDNDDLEEAIKNFDILSTAPSDILYQSLIEYGLLAELVGRIPVIAPLKPLSKIELRQCLSGVDHSPFKKLEAVFWDSGYKIEFSDELVDAIIERAYKMATGTRSLSTLVKKITSVAFFKYISTEHQKNVSNRIIFDKASLDDPSIFFVEPIIKSRQVGLATHINVVEA